MCSSVCCVQVLDDAVAQRDDARRELYAAIDEFNEAVSQLPLEER